MLVEAIDESCSVRRVAPGHLAVSVVIPALNEARNLQHVFAALPPNLHQVILVDGRSADDTIAVARRLRHNIDIVHQTRRGKGNALACGFAVATGDIIVMLDADGSADPREIPRFVEALRQGADFAKGSRFIRGGGSADISCLRRVGNFWLNKLVNVLYETGYSDLCYGYNAFWKDCLEAFRLDPVELGQPEAFAMRWGDGFEVETLINIRIAKAGLKVVEVPSFERNRVHGRSNLNAFSDGFRVLQVIRTERSRRRRRAAEAGAVFLTTHATQRRNLMNMVKALVGGLKNGGPTIMRSSQANGAAEVTVQS